MNIFVEWWTYVSKDESKPISVDVNCISWLYKGHLLFAYGVLAHTNIFLIDSSTGQRQCDASNPLCMGSSIPVHVIG